MATAEVAVPAGAEVETRRGFLQYAGWGTIGLIIVQALLAFVFFFWPRKIGSFGGKITAGGVDDFKPGDVKYFVDGKFYLVRLGPNDVGADRGEGGFLALYQKCPHLGCTVPWKPEFVWPFQGQNVTGLFRCPCHGSTYLKTGQIIFGPAPRPMDLMKVTITPEKKVQVDTSVVVPEPGPKSKRDRYDPSQVVKP